MNQKTQNIVIIGGGAAGLTAAISAARGGASVTIVEKNQRLGEKLRISGGGRCNIYNDEPDTRTLISNYRDSAKFLHSAFDVFGREESKAFFDELGLPTKVEARNRAFPVSEKADDVVDALESECRALGVEIMRGAEVDSVIGTKGVISAVQLLSGAEIPVDQLILATGGLSRPETGSTGDGFGWLKKLGHTIKEPNPNITPLKTSDPWLDTVSGTSLESAKITFYVNGKSSFKATGRILFTHFGISGPLILNNAYRVSELLDEGTVTAVIDTLPMTRTEDLDAKIIKNLEKYPKKQLKNILPEVTPKGIQPLVMELLKDEINFEMKTSEVSKIKRESIVNTIKGVPVTIEGLMGFEKAVVADGGVTLTEVDTRTFRSHKIKNLYIVGDLLNINRPTGGFSLQLCWTTGFIAGKDAASRDS